MLPTNETNRMNSPTKRTIEEWVAFYNQMEMPILRQTARRLEGAKERVDTVNGRDIAVIVLQDPLMAIRVLSYIQAFGSKRLHSDITTIANAVMMLGVEPFFSRFETPLTIESMLKDEPQAMLGVLQVIRRAQRASHYAHDWAFYRHDIDIEEVELAALLHDLSEILLWCFAPGMAIEIQRRLSADQTLRSAMVQEQVLGFALVDLQLALCREWKLPELLTTLMDDANAHLPRVQNVTLAVNLARHTARGWSDAALPDDMNAIEKLLHIGREPLLHRLDVPADDIKRFLPEDGQGD